ncbi:hypothetical protein ABZZ36_10280 [Actinacidiphila glaucinigra]|uniref:hypothetical protein n=1 Tax=Actinacidiphila glaucinigra TaxID=235986 RepID=UPI0033BAC3D3
MATGTAIDAGTVVNLRDLGGIPLAGAGTGHVAAYARHGLRLPDPAVARLREGVVGTVGEAGPGRGSSHAP